MGSLVNSKGLYNYLNNDFVVDKTFYDFDYQNETDIFIGIKIYYRNIKTNQNYVGIFIQAIRNTYTVQSVQWKKNISDSIYYKYTSFTFKKYINILYILPNLIDSSLNYIVTADLNDYSAVNESTVSLNFTSEHNNTLWSSLKMGGLFVRRQGTGNHTTLIFNVLQGSHYFSSNDAKRMCLAVSVEEFNYDNLNNIVTISLSDRNYYLNTQYLQYSAGTTLSVDFGTTNNEYFLRNFGVCYALKTSDNKNFWGVCNFVTSSVTLSDNQPMFKMGAISNNVLVNNGLVSGLSLPGGKILVTDWNTVDLEGINVNSVLESVNEFVCLSCVFRDTDGNHYLLHNDEEIIPSIREINGLLVLNVNQLDNCYRLSDGKILTFAPAWNNRASSSNLITFSEARTENHNYLASSVNEYKLKDNASIILNPVPVVTDAIFVIQNNDYSFTVKDLKNFYSNNKEFAINFYSGSLSASEFLYKGSTDYKTVGFVFNESLADLPFPLDTNGNVQYSPSLFCETFSSFGNDVFIKQGNSAYQLMKVDSEAVMSFYLGTLVEGLEDVFVIQGQYYGIINNQIFAITFANGVVQSMTSIVSTVGLQFCGNSPYMAIFFSKTNRCLYSFTGANVLNKLQFVDKISEIKGYKYNPATQSIFLLTDIGLVISSLFGMYSLESQWNKLFVYDKGIALVNDTNITWLEYYAREGFEKQLIELETCFYGMNNQTVTINDCLYVRLFSEEHEEGSIKVTATTISNSGRKTEQTEFKIKKSDWDKLTDSIYLRYQPKEQRGLGISFSISSPFKIASLSIGSQADAILIDKVSKGAINAPQVTSSNIKW